MGSTPRRCGYRAEPEHLLTQMRHLAEQVATMVVGTLLLAVIFSLRVVFGFPRTASGPAFAGPLCIYRKSRAHSTS
jgi:hypothetical protein